MLPFRSAISHGPDVAGGIERSVRRGYGPGLASIPSGVEATLKIAP